MTATTTASPAERVLVTDGGARPRVVYLLGAGATQGCISYRGSDMSLLMRGPMATELLDKMRELAVSKKYRSNDSIQRLVNDVVTTDTDFEHLMSFIEDAVSNIYADFGRDLRLVFSKVLRHRLGKVRKELGTRHSELYSVLIDMHNIPRLNEELAGFLTLNYDGFLEDALGRLHKRPVDYGVNVEPRRKLKGIGVPVLKLHGSFGWTEGWPLAEASPNSPGYWIPPGIRKVKGPYPFNALWGRARELLDCEILRIIGCNLGPNDWDLISLLFTTMHTSDAPPYRVEVISSPSTAHRIRETFPYLDPQCIFELPGVGAEVMTEYSIYGRRPYEDLDETEKSALADRFSERNVFFYWLTQRAEVLNRLLGSISTDSGIFENFADRVTI